MAVEVYVIATSSLGDRSYLATDGQVGIVASDGGWCPRPSAA